MKQQTETFYEVLKVDRKASVAEIVSAYHAARGAYSKDSVATYSLFTAEEIQEELQKLEEAYVTLSNIDKRADYDRRLANGGEEMDLKDDDKGENDNAATVLRAPTESSPTTPLPTHESNVAQVSEEVSGAYLKDVREKRGLSPDDVCRITKIPSRFLRAIEADDFRNLPARVYVQGFIKNMASLYRLEAKSLAAGYLAYLNKHNPNPTP